MKKYLALICAAMLCVCCLALAACGGGSGSAATASGSASASASSSSATAADKAVGSWQLAAIESQGITIAGDFSMFLGSNDKITLNIEKDGKATMSMGSQTANLTWEASGNDIKFKKDESASASSASASASASSSSTSSSPFFDDSSSSSSEFTATIKDNALVIDISQDGTSMSMIFTADGTYADAKVIDVNKADKVTSESDLVGDWKLSGMNMMGISMYGDPSDLSAMMGSTAASSTDLTAKFEAGGKATLMGEACTYTVDSNGATISMSGQSLPVKKLGDDIVIDFSGIYGMDFAFAFSK
jgi:hypothetical protein